MTNPTIDREGNKRWYNDNDKDQLHRLKDPAVEKTNGDKSWYQYGDKYTEKEYLLKIHEG